MRASLQSGWPVTTSLRASAALPRHRAADWSSGVTRAPRPFTVAVHREGDQHALYLSPTRLGALARWLALPGEDQAVLLDPEPGVPTRVMLWAELDGRDLDGDVVHLPASASPDPDALSELPSPLLTSLAEALPRPLGARVALSVQDRGHGVVVAREQALLARCLGGFLQDFLLTFLSGEVAPPAFTARVMAPLLEPLPAESWFSLDFQVHRRYWTLDARREGERSSSLRWVCEGPQGRWRSGWSWATSGP